MKLDERTLEALTSLRGSREFMLFCTAIESELKKADLTLRKCGPDTFQRVQGRAEFAAEILNEVASANDTYHKLRNR